MPGKNEVPFDVTKSARENMMEWVGDDDRMMMLVRHCDANSIYMGFLPGEKVCYIDVYAPNGKRITGSGQHSMVIDLVNDTVTLLGCADINEGIIKIGKVFDGFAKKSLAKELDKLLTL